MSIFRPTTSINSTIFYTLSLDQKIEDSNRGNYFSNSYCTLPSTLCKRVSTLIDLPKLFKTKSPSLTGNLQHSVGNNRIYYIEPNLYEVPPTKYGFSVEEFLAKTLKKPNLIKFDQGHGDTNTFQERSNEMLKSFVVWVNNWTESVSNNLKFETVKTYFEKLVPEKVM